MDDKARLFHEYKIKQNQLIEALDALEAMVREHCEDEDGTLHSLGVRVNADAMRLLEKHGRVKTEFPADASDEAPAFSQLQGKWITKEERKGGQAHEAVEGSQEG